MSDYFKLVLKVDDQLVLVSFSIISMTGPTLGVILGNLTLIKFYK